MSRGRAGRSAQHVASRPERQPSDLARTAPLVVLGMALVGWTLQSVSLVRKLWFFADDFDFLLNRTATLGGDRGLFVPHNEHWSTLPILLYRLNFRLFGLHHYTPYALMPIVCHVVITALMYALLRSNGVGAWVAAFCALVTAYFAGGVGAENILWDFQVGFLLSGALGLVALTAVSAGVGPMRGRVLAVAALILALASSGIGLVVVLWVGAYTLLRSGLRFSVSTVAVPGLVALCWYAAVGHKHTRPPTPDVSVGLEATVHGLAHIWSGLVLLPYSGPVVMALLVVAAIGVRGRQSLFSLAASGLVTLVMAYLLFGYTRSGFGIDGATASRYAYFGVVFTVPSLAAGMEILVAVVRRWWSLIPVLTWVAAATAVVIVGSLQLNRADDRVRAAVRDNAPRLVASATLVVEGAHILRPDAVPLFNSALTTASLAKPSALAAMPSIEPGRRAELDASTNLQVDINPSSFGFHWAATYEWEHGESPPNSKKGRRGSGCSVRHLTIPDTLDIPLGEDPAQVRLVVSGREINVSLASQGVESADLPWPTTPGAPFYVASTASNVTLRIAVPAGDVKVCAGE